MLAGGCRSTPEHRFSSKPSLSEAQLVLDRATGELLVHWARQQDEKSGARRVGSMLAKVEANAAALRKFRSRDSIGLEPASIQNLRMAYLTALDVLAENLANINEAGYKRKQVELEMSDGLPRNAIITRNCSQGEMVATGELLDISIEGDGFFEVLLPDGTKGFTRDGTWRTQSDGRIISKAGYLMQSGAQPIMPGTRRILVTPNGEVTTEGESGVTSFSIQISRFSNPEGLEYIGNGVFLETIASGAAEMGAPGSWGFGSLRQGFLEQSNVNVALELRNLVRIQQSFMQSETLISNSSH